MAKQTIASVRTRYRAGKALAPLGYLRIPRGGGSPSAPRWAKALLLAALCVHVAMFFSLMFGYLNPLFNDSAGSKTQGIDFFSIYRSGTYLLHGRSIYSEAEVYVPYGSSPYASPYRYVPFIAETAGVAFNRLSAWNAYWLWVSLIEVMLAANVWLTLQLIKDRTWACITAAMWLLFTPLYLEEYMGQWSFFMATLMFLTGIYLAMDRPLAASWPWGLSLTIKSNTALFLPIFVRLRQWRVILLLAMIVAALNVPYFLAFPGDTRRFWHLNIGQYVNPTPLRRETLLSGDYGFVAFLHAEWLARWSSDVPAVVLGSYGLFIISTSLVATFLPRRADVTVLFGVWSSVFFLIYLSWQHHYVMLLPALVLITGTRADYRWITLVVYLLVALPTPYFIFSHTFQPQVPHIGVQVNRQIDWPAWAGVLEHGSKAVPTFVLWLTLSGSEIVRGWRSRVSA